jgi:hypothetical protein
VSLKNKSEINMISTFDVSPEDLTPAMQMYLNTKRENS